MGKGRAFAVGVLTAALGAVAVVAVVAVRGRSADAPAAEKPASAEGKRKPILSEDVRPETQARREAPPGRPGPSASRRAPRAKEALVALFAVKPGEMPPELPPLTFEDRNLLPLIIENELTDADGCDAAAVRREFRLFMECGGNHAEFLPAYRRKLLKRAR